MTDTFNILPQHNGINAQHLPPRLLQNEAVDERTGRESQDAGQNPSKGLWAICRWIWLCGEAPDSGHPTDQAFYRKRRPYSVISRLALRQTHFSLRLVTGRSCRRRSRSYVRAGPRATVWATPFHRVRPRPRLPRWPLWYHCPWYR